MRRVVILGLALALAGCSSNTTSPSVSLTGSYQLRTINGQALPYTFSNGLTLSDDVLSLNNDGTFVDISSYSNGQTSTQQGFFTNNNGAIVFSNQTSGISYQGSLSGSVLTEIVSGFTQAYQKM